MSKRNDAPTLILALIATLGVLGFSGWWVVQQLGLMRVGPEPSVSTPDPNAGASSPETPAGDMAQNSQNASQSLPAGSSGGAAAIADRLSLGTKALFTDDTTPEKQRAIAAMQSGDYTNAVSALEASLQQNRNDPEALIYLNNARIGDRPAHTIAVSVPAATAANPAREILRGVAQAQQQVNQTGGINGTPLKVVIASDDNDPQVAAAVATALVEDSSVLGVIGHFGSETTLTASEVYEQGRLSVISPTSTSIQISEAGEYVFRTVPSDRFTANTLSRYAINNLGLTSIAVFYNEDSSYSQSLKNEFTTALFADGGQVTFEVNVAHPDFDAASMVAMAIADGHDGIFLATNTATLDQALQVVQANDQRLTLLGGDSLYNPDVLEQGGAIAEGMVVAVPWVLLSDPQTEFVETSRQLWGGDVNWRTAMTYDAAIALIESIRRDPTRQGVQQALAASNFQVQGATGTVKFLPSGDRNQAMQLVVVEPGTRSGYGYDFRPVRP